AEAVPHPRVTYLQSAELAPSLADGSVDLVTAAQAAHWFDLGKFYPEVRRVCRPGALLAVWNYAICRIGPEVDPLVRRFHDVTVGPWWPPERKHAETCYQHLHFPFPELAFPPLEIQVDWTLEEFLTYLGTWSAVTRYTQTHGTDPVNRFGTELAAVWGEGARRITWPVGGRLGRVGKGYQPSPVS
ncbi:MAG: class I SAM-dependent methyltransferase, partial [Opitutales bacterium]